MIERHTANFACFALNIASDDEGRTISVQFERIGGGDRPLRSFLRVVRRRFGSDLLGRWHRWRLGAADPIRLGPGWTAPADRPGIFRLQADVRPGVATGAALAALFDLFRDQPGYMRMEGPPPGPEAGSTQVPMIWADGASAASDLGRRIFDEPSGRVAAGSGG